MESNAFRDNFNQFNRIMQIYKIIGKKSVFVMKFYFDKQK